MKRVAAGVAAALLVSFVPGTAIAGVSFLWLPFSGHKPITCDFVCYRNHRAIDFGLANSTRVLAAAAGEVALVHDGVPENTHPARREFGNQVRILHPNGYLTIYAHFFPGTITVHVGDHVVAGQRLGLSDNTGKSSGPHLHFEVRDPSGVRVNPYGDPPDYTGGCGPGALWAACPPAIASGPIDEDNDGYTSVDGDCAEGYPGIHPGAPERCNNKDDDCDGETDEDWHSGLAQDIGNACSINWGARCGTSMGHWVCATGGLSTVCNAPARPGRERCNGQDDDCDGITDNVTEWPDDGDPRHCGACDRACQSGERCRVNGCWCNFPDVCTEYCRWSSCSCGTLEHGCLYPAYDDCLSYCSSSAMDPDTYAIACSQGCMGLLEFLR